MIGYDKQCLRVGDYTTDSRIITEEDILNFAQLSGDNNYIHTDKEKAKSSAFGGQIAHGMFVGSTISKILGSKFPGPGTIYLEQSLKFLKPVFVGDTVITTVSICEIINAEKGIYKLDTNIKNQNNEDVIEGYAVIKYNTNSTNDKYHPSETMENGINIKTILPDYDFYVTGSSFAGEPRDNTIMYIASKIGYLINNLKGHTNCVCFVADDIDVPTDIQENNAIIYSKNPAYDYAVFANKVLDEIRQKEQSFKYVLQEGGYYTGCNVKIGKNARIEPGVLIGHNVIIGDNATIKSGAVIKHAIIGNDFLCNENAVVGDYAFTMATDDDGNKYRIPSLGRVIIGDFVEVGANNDVATGSCGDTILEDYVKLDGLVHIGHEAHLHKNTLVTAGGIVAGFVEMDDNSYIGINSGIKQWTKLGKNSFVGMGSVVIRPVSDNETVVGSPARNIEDIKTKKGN